MPGFRHSSRFFISGFERRAVSLAFASRRVAAASSSILFLLMPLPAASSPRHASLVNGCYRKVCMIASHGAGSKRGETLPDSVKMLLLFGCVAACTAIIINGCAPDFYHCFKATLQSVDFFIIPSVKSSRVCPRERGSGHGGRYWR